MALLGSMEDQRKLNLRKNIQGKFNLSHMTRWFKLILLTFVYNIDNEPKRNEQKNLRIYEKNLDLASLDLGVRSPSQVQGWMID